MRYLWYSMYFFATTLALYAVFFRPLESREQVPPTSQTVAVDEEQAQVQIAILLDTSSSMDGLVAQARAQLWEMVAEMQIGSDGDERVVAVSLFQYGNNRLAKSQGFIEKLTPLTTELDAVTVKLHSLTTSGGKEYAPQAILRAVEELDWSGDDDVEKLIVVAGNEGFNQGSIGTQEALKAAEKLGIRVLPVYCANRGASRTAIASWRLAAELAGTDFESIDPDQQVANAETPYDQEILIKCRALEETRVYEVPVSTRYRSQAESFSLGSVAVDRALVQSRQTVNRDISNEKVKQAKLKAEIAELSKKRKAHLRSNAPQSSPKALNLGQSFRRNVRNR